MLFKAIRLDENKQGVIPVNGKECEGRAQDAWETGAESRQKGSQTFVVT